MKHHPEITDSMVEIFTSILLGGDHNKRRAAELIRKLDAASRRDLLAACQDLDNLIDDTWLEELREKRRGKRSYPPHSSRAGESTHADAARNVRHFSQENL